MAYLVVEVDATEGLLVREGQRVEAGQRIGRSRLGRDHVLAERPGTVRYIQFDAGNHSLLVYILPND